RVALRVKKPLESNEQVISFVKDEEKAQIYLADNKLFTFDFVYPPYSTQQHVYESSILPLLDTFIEGKNITVLAYGQAGSGKTYSLGTGLEMNVKDQGIIQRFTNSLFKRMIEYSSKSLGRVSFEISVSYIEVVDNEDVKDLLNEPTNQVVHPFDTTTSAGSDYPSIREDVQGNIVWTGIKVNSVNDVLSFLKKKTQSRTDMMNTPSSSSFIFSIILEQHVENDDTLVENDIPTHLVSKFHFVDLASSQSVRETSLL
ncbi:P-loop containing nucleoside triphosphate hydrolase protein, partial [Thamnidium elegans]